VLLVDDVLTTGATIEAAATTLKEAGAGTVLGIVFAHAA
jgi:predicted amidophosphoribosyltransferase